MSETYTACDGCGMPATGRCPHCQALSCDDCSTCEHKPPIQEWRLPVEKSGDQKSTTGAERGERSRGLGEQQNGESLVVSAPPPVAGVTECGACDKPGEHCSNIYGICSRHGGHPPRTSAETSEHHHYWRPVHGGFDYVCSCGATLPADQV